MDNRQNEIDVINEFLPDEIICNLILQGGEAEHGRAEVFLRLAQTSKAMRNKLENILYNNPEFTHAILSNCSQAQLAAFFKQFPAPAADKFKNMNPACFVLLAPQHIKDLIKDNEIIIINQINQYGSMPNQKNLHTSLMLTYLSARPEKVNPKYNIKRDDTPFINLCKATPHDRIISIMNRNPAMYEHTYMAGATLTAARIEDVDLSGANLQGLTLNYLNGDRFKGCFVTRVNFSNADLSNANLSHAAIDNSIFKQTNIRAAKINRSILESSNKLDPITLCSLPTSCFLDNSDFVKNGRFTLLLRLNYIKSDYYDRLPTDNDKKLFRNILVAQIKSILSEDASLARDKLCKTLCTHPLFSEHRDARKHISLGMFDGTTSAQAKIRSAFDEAMKTSKTNQAPRPRK